MINWISVKKQRPVSTQFVLIAYVSGEGEAFQHKLTVGTFRYDDAVVDYEYGLRIPMERVTHWAEKQEIELPRISSAQYWGLPPITEEPYQTYHNGEYVDCTHRFLVQRTS